MICARLLIMVARFALKLAPELPFSPLSKWRCMTFREVIAILEDHGFNLARQRGSHRTYTGMVEGKIRVVVVACHRESDDIRPGTLSSMIRQSGLPKSLFRG